jgi:thiol-disulfide isomerase/thioredoxin
MDARALLSRVMALRERRVVRWALDAALVLAIVLAVSLWQTRSHVRGLAPDFAVATLAGEPVTRSTFAGKPTLLAFWAPWCGVCRANEDNVARLKEWAGERAHVVTVASDYQDADEVRAYVTKHGVGDPVLLGGTATARAFRVQAFPTFYFLDAEGRITGSSVGYTTTAGLAARLFALP